jgi:hypothetical protein
MKVDKKQFDSMLSALLKAPPTPFEAIKTGRPKKERPNPKPPKK